jgi:hypothetical protein
VHAMCTKCAPGAFVDRRNFKQKSPLCHELGAKAEREGFNRALLRNSRSLLPFRRKHQKWKEVPFTDNPRSFPVVSTPLAMEIAQI